jgi:hypothetical protein
MKEAYRQGICRPIINDAYEVANRVLKQEHLDLFFQMKRPRLMESGYMK